MENNSNNIPFLFDNDADQRLLGSLFPDGDISSGFRANNSPPQSPVFPNNRSSNRNSIFEFLEEESPLGNWTKDNDHNSFIKYYFHNAAISQQNNITFYNNLEGNRNSDLKWFVENSNPNYIINIFVDSDGVALLEQYKNKPIAKNEIAIFFESDDSFNIVGSVYRVRLGKDVIKDLKDYWFFKKTDDLAEELIKQYPILKEIGQDRLEKLLDQEIDLEPWTIEFGNWYRINRLVPLDLLNIFSIAAEGFRSIRPENPKFWDATRDDYDPLFPTVGLINTLDLDFDNISESLADGIIKLVDGFFDNTQKDKQRFLNTLGIIVPDWVKDTVNNNFNLAKEIYFQEIRPRIKDFIETTLVATEEYIYFVTAFLTGAISGLSLIHI